MKPQITSQVIDIKNKKQVDRINVAKFLEVMGFDIPDEAELLKEHCEHDVLFWQVNGWSTCTGKEPNCTILEFISTYTPMTTYRMSDLADIGYYMDTCGYKTLF